MALLRSGKVPLFTGDERNTFRRMNSGKSVLWDPATGADQNVPLSRNLFCSGHCALPDGRLLVAGGQSLAQDILGTLLSLLGLGRGVDHDIHTFDPLAETWTRHQDMPRPAITCSFCWTRPGCPPWPASCRCSSGRPAFDCPRVRFLIR